MEENEHSALMEHLAGRRPSPEELIRLIDSGCDPRVLVRQICLDGIPHALRSHWATWEQLRDIAATHLSVSPHQVRMNGSANHGFSWRQRTPWERTTSDLDLFIISPVHFNSITTAAAKWMSEEEESTSSLPTNKQEQFKRIRTQQKNGFITLKLLRQKLGPLGKFKSCRTRITRLALETGIITGPKPKRKVTFRVYRDFAAAEKQLTVNMKRCREMNFQRSS